MLTWTSIILRAFQGVGGGGSFALASILLIESVPPEKYAAAVAQNGIPVVLGYVLGPIIGGGISERTTWRWIFIIKLATPSCQRRHAVQSSDAC